MTHDEATRLARSWHTNPIIPGTVHIPSGKLNALCDYILSGDMKREIENAAYRKAAKVIGSCAQSVGEEETIADAQRAIRSLIQPPAQKENGE